MDNTYVFVEKLASKAPVPGGGGASAMMGAIATALCSMVGNLTTGKKKYAQYQEDIDAILEKCDRKIKKCLSLIDEDAKVFEPLSRAYGIPKDEPDRDKILETELKNACTVPYEILSETMKLTELVEELYVKGSRLAISDVAVAATALKAAAEGAAMNVYINTKLMKDREYAEKINCKTKEILKDVVYRCSEVYNNILEQLSNQ